MSALQKEECVQMADVLTPLALSDANALMALSHPKTFLNALVTGIMSRNSVCSQSAGMRILTRNNILQTGEKDFVSVNLSVASVSREIAQLHSAEPPKWIAAARWVQPGDLDANDVLCPAPQPTKSSVLKLDTQLMGQVTKM